jgi:hypothetical protein
MKNFSHPSGFRFFLFIALVAAFFLTAFQTAQPGGIPPWILILIVILVILIVWYYFRSRQPVSTPAKPESRSYTPPAAEDDLAIIEGIGPKIAEILKSAGITTFNQLASTDVSRLREILDRGGIRLADPQSWPEQARLAAAGDQSGLMALQDRLKGGRTV